MNFPGVIVNRRGDTTNMQFVLFQVAGVTLLADSIELGLEFLKIANRVGSKSLERQLRKQRLAFLRGHVGKHDFTCRRAIQGSRRSDARMDPQMFRRIELLDVNGGEAVPDG